MKDLITYIKSIFVKKNNPEYAEEEAEASEDSIDSSGSITFFWDSATGDFQVMTDVYDWSQDSSEVLGMLLSYISEGHMSSYMVQSLKLWASENSSIEATDEFYTNTLKVWSMMNEFDSATSNKTDSPVINPVDVFRITRSNGGA